MRHYPGYWVISLICFATILIAGCGQAPEDKTEAWQQCRQQALQYFRDRKRDRALVAYHRALQLARSIDPQGMMVADTYRELAAVYLAGDDYENAAHSFNQVVLLLEKQNSRKPLDAGASSCLCEAFEGLGNIHCRQHNLPLAESFYREAAKLISSAALSPARQQQIISKYRNVLVALNRREEAQMVDEHFKYVFAPVAGKLTQSRQSLMAHKHIQQAQQLAAAGDGRHARGEYMQALHYADGMHDLKLRARINYECATFLFTRGEVEYAGNLYQQSLRDYKACGASRRDLRAVLTGLYRVRLKELRYDEAETAARLALRCAEEQEGKDSIAAAQCLNDLAAVYVTRRDYSRAVPLFERAHGIRLKLMPSSALTQDSCWLVNLCWISAEKSKARHYMSELARVLKAMPSDEKRIQAKLISDFAAECLRQGHTEEGALFSATAAGLLRDEACFVRRHGHQGQTQARDKGAKSRRII